MPVYEILTSEIVLTKFHIEAETEEEAIENVYNGTIISQKLTYPDIEEIEVVSE